MPVTWKTGKTQDTCRSSRSCLGGVIGHLSCPCWGRGDSLDRICCHEIDVLYQVQPLRYATGTWASPDFNLYPCFYQKRQCSPGAYGSKQNKGSVVTAAMRTYSTYLHVFHAAWLADLHRSWLHTMGHEEQIPASFNVFVIHINYGETAILMWLIQVKWW